MYWLFQHTAARRRLHGSIRTRKLTTDVSTHSRAEAAAEAEYHAQIEGAVSTHSRAEAAVLCAYSQAYGWWLFQHTAARRRLHRIAKIKELSPGVSTHSRAEAAA